MNTRTTEAPNVKSLRRTRQASLDEVVRRLADIHAQLSGRYGHLADQATVERVQLILRYLSGQEAALTVYLHRFLEQAPEAVLNRRFKYVPDLEGNDLFIAIESRHPESAEEVVELLREIHQAIDAVYAPLNENLLPDELAEAVDKLRLQEREHVIQQLRAAIAE